MADAKRCGKREGCGLPRRCAVGRSQAAWWEDSGQLKGGFKGWLLISAYFFQSFKRRCFDNHFLLSCFQSHICGCFNFSSCNFKVDMNKNCVKYLHGINFSQLALSEKADVKNSGRAAPNLLFSHNKA
jgi:hypothetical protein